MARTHALAAVALVLAGSSARAQEARLVEVVLAERLDEPRGYCLDIVGPQRRAMPERGIHAHSCYSYQGRIAVDQGFEAERIAAGELRIPWFKVCVTIGEARPGARLALAACDGGPGQRFDLLASGRIVARQAPGLCLTVADGKGAPGGGGQPVHVMRRLTLETCENNSAGRQTWRLRANAD